MHNKLGIYVERRIRDKSRQSPNLLEKVKFRLLERRVREPITRKY